MPGGPQIHESSQFQEWFELGISTYWSDGMKTYPITYTEIFEDRDQEILTETDIAYSGLGVMPTKEEGGVVATDKILKGPKKDHTIGFYALAAIITHEAQRWGRNGIFKNLFSELPKTATDRFNLIAYRALDEAFSTSTPAYQTFQGEPMISSAHTRLDGGTWDNAGTAGLSYDAIQDALVKFKKLRNERGKFAMMTPVTCVVPVELEWIARTLYYSDGVAGTANKDVNLLKSGSVKKVTSSPFIASETAWWLFARPSQLRMGMRVGDRPKLMFKDYNPNTMDRMALAYCSMGWWMMDSRGSYGSTGGA